MSVKNGLVNSALNKFISGYSGGDVKQTVVDLATDSTIVSAVPAVLVGAYVNTVLSAHILPIKDDTATILNVPASTAVGAIDFGNAGAGIRFETSLVVDPDNVATGEVVIYWKEIVE